MKLTFDLWPPKSNHQNPSVSFWVVLFINKWIIKLTIICLLEAIKSKQNRLWVLPGECPLSHSLFRGHWTLTPTPRPESDPPVTAANWASQTPLVVYSEKYVEKSFSTCSCVRTHAIYFENEITTSAKLAREPTNHHLRNFCYISLLSDENAWETQHAPPGGDGGMTGCWGRYRWTRFIGSASTPSSFPGHETVPREGREEMERCDNAAIFIY